jgi:hypothetical protein
VANELHRAPSTLEFRDIADLNDRLCRLRITAAANVMRDNLGHVIPDHVLRQLTPSMIFQEEEREVTRGGSDLAVACRALMAVARGAPVMPPNDEPDPLDPARVSGEGSSGGPSNPVPGRAVGHFSDVDMEQGQG